MKFMLLPWKPELVFTGTSVMGVNPENGKFCSHVVGFKLRSFVTRIVVVDFIYVAGFYVGIFNLLSLNFAGLLGFIKEK